MHGSLINIQIITLGKFKDKYMKDFSLEYEKRLKAYCNFQILELEPYRLSDNPSQKEIETALTKEADLIKSKIPKNSYVFAMCIEGKQMSSEELSEKISQIALCGKNNITFIIGSSFGLDREVKNSADFKFSMSKMTFPHKLARIMITEQIYRAFSIMNNGKYHK